MFYFTIDYNLPKEALVFPVFLRSFGYVMIAICFLTSLSRVPFQFFFQAVSIQGFVCAGFGGVLGTAILNRVFVIVIKKNALLLGASIDHVNSTVGQISMGQLYGAVQQQALMVTMKEIYRWLTLLGLFCLLLFCLKVRFGFWDTSFYNSLKYPITSNISRLILYFYIHTKINCNKI